MASTKLSTTTDTIPTPDFNTVSEISSKVSFRWHRHLPDVLLHHKSMFFYYILILGELCPNGLRLHGSENLLHRATAEGNAIVVSELLNCGYRNLSAKNHDGQSAVHLGNRIFILIHHGFSLLFNRIKLEICS